MRLALVAAGKLKDAGLQSLCAEYLRRIQPFAPLEVVEVRDAAGLRAHWCRHASPTIRVLLDEQGEPLWNAAHDAQTIDPKLQSAALRSVADKHQPLLPPVGRDNGSQLACRSDGL